MRFVSLLSWMLIAAPLSAHAEKGWENCLDIIDFSFDFDASFSDASTTTVRKEGCKFTLTVSGGHGEKYVTNVCESGIQIDFYQTLESLPRHVIASSASCPTPTFGADFDGNAKEINEFKEKRARIFELFDKVKQSYGEGWEKIDLNKASRFSVEDSPAKIACGQYLLSEYLTRCMPFEAKKKAPSAPIPVNPDMIGIHPQSIIKK